MKNVRAVRLLVHRAWWWHRLSRALARIVGARSRHRLISDDRALDLSMRPVHLMLRVQSASRYGVAGPRSA